MQTNFKEELLMKKARKIIGRNSIFQIVQDDATELTYQTQAVYEVDHEFVVISLF